MKILIADDDMISRTILNEVLVRLDYEVCSTDNGRDALEEYRKEHFPIVISDWMMPEMDGLELCQKIRSLQGKKYTYFFLLTVKEGKNNYLKAMSVGADDFITKPLDIDTLSARLRVAERLLHLQDQNILLSRLIPICAHCKKIRNDETYWQEIDHFLIESAGASFSHGICPECLKRYFGEFAEEPE